MKKVMWVSVFLGIILCLGTGWAQTVKEVPIGAIYPLSGPVAEIGQTCLKGVTLAIEQKNQEGGIKSLGRGEDQFDCRGYTGKTGDRGCGN